MPLIIAQSENSMCIRKMSCELFVMLLNNRGLTELITGKVLRLKSKPVCNVLLSLKLFIIQHLEARCSTLKISSRATNSLEMSKKFSHRKISCLINTLTTTTTEERKKKRDKPYRLVTLLLPSPHDVRFFVSLF